jgi:hypothetical protein
LTPRTLVAALVVAVFAAVFSSASGGPRLLSGNYRLAN